VTFGPRLLVIALAAFASAGLVAAATLVLCWRRPTGSAAARATSLFWLRLTPAAASVVVSLLAIVSFSRFEPRAGQERTGVVLLALAATAAAALATMAIRLVRGHLAARRALREWMAAAEPVVLPNVTLPAYVVAASFPVVAVVGVVRPRLIIARSVLDSCPADELDAIFAHESGHLRRRDNARRAILCAVPDVLTWVRWSRHVRESWHAAAEEAADDEAAHLGDTGRLRLATALLRVARLAPVGTPEANLPASALYRGEAIERRVRRLLDPALEITGRSGVSRWMASSAAALLGVSLLTLHSIHELVEAAVSYLP